MTNSGQLGEEHQSYLVWISSLSENVKIDWRRRRDEVMAIIEYIDPIWTNVRKLVQEKSEWEKSKWKKVWIGLFIVGALINWLIQGAQFDFFAVQKLELNAGTWMMTIGAVGYFYILYEIWSREKELARLSERHHDFRFKWLACGASNSSFESLRKCHREEGAIIFGFNDSLLNDIHRDLYCSASGEGPPY